MDASLESRGVGPRDRPAAAAGAIEMTDDDEPEPGRPPRRAPGQPSPEAALSAETAPPAEIDAPAEIDVLSEAPAWAAALPAAAATVARAARAALAAAGPAGPCGVAIALADDAAVRRLNAAYRGRDKPTNVLSFPDGELDPEGRRALGDIILAYETVAAEAAQQGKLLADHLGHLTVHGLLHLLGWDHETEAEAEAMEALERRILAGLGIADPYAAAHAGPAPGETRTAEAAER